jgi:hypothetical protein
MHVGWIFGFFFWPALINFIHYVPAPPLCTSVNVKYRVRIKYQRISWHHNLSRKCCKIVKFVSITHSERKFGMAL